MVTQRFDDQDSGVHCSSHLLGLLEMPKPTVEWCALFDEALSAETCRREQSVDCLADSIRRQFLCGEWDFRRADHAINMLAGYAQRNDLEPPVYWRIYLAFDRAEYVTVDERVLRAELARPGDRVIRHDSCWHPSEFDEWGRGERVGVIVPPPMPLHDLGRVDVRWPAGRCVKDVEGLRWL